MTLPPDDSAPPPATPPGPPPPPPAAQWAPPGDAQPMYGAPVPGLYYDPQSGLQLPEGVQLASIGRRIGAYFLSIPLAIVTLGIGYVIWGLVIWPQGQTPALQVLGMRCWRPETREVPGFWWMALREVVGRIAEGVLSLLTELVSFILFLTGRERKSLHDWIAGTVVVHDPDRRLQR